jgi:DNA-binding response OmpR family regulator
MHGRTARPFVVPATLGPISPSHSPPQPFDHEDVTMASHALHSSYSPIAMPRSKVLEPTRHFETYIHYNAGAALARVRKADWRERQMAGERPILIVDDDRSLREELAAQLQVDGEFLAEEAGSVAEAEARLAATDHRLDALILDVSLPDGDGRDFCAELRRQGLRVPIIMLTGSDEEADVVRGLEAGANDYIAKPFRLNELLARLRAQLRIFENSEDAVFTIGPYTFRPSAKLLQEPVRNRRIRLTEKEAAILKFLYRSGTKPVARQILLNEVWGYNAAVTTHTLETHIYRLRQKIEPDPANARLLVTEGGGYRLDPGGIAA